MHMMEPHRFARQGLVPLALLLGLGLGACAPLFEAVQDSLIQEKAAPAEESEYERGKHELTAGRMGLAVLYFRAALVESPESIEALNGLGAAFDRLGRFDLSARAYDRALALAPQDAQTLNNLGYSYLLQGRYNLAVAYLRQASILAEGDARVAANRHLADLALARAGGTASGQAAPGLTAPGTAGDTGDIAFKPHLIRTGKALRHLVTQSPAPAVAASPARPAGFAIGAEPRVSSLDRAQPDPLPEFLAAPMALSGHLPGGPTLGALTLTP